MQVPDGRHNHFLLAPSLNIDRKQKEDLADQSEEGTGAAEAEAEAGQGTIVRPLMNGGERVRLTDGRARAGGRRDAGVRGPLIGGPRDELD